MFTYRVFGLPIHSDRTVPALREWSGEWGHEGVRVSWTWPPNLDGVDFRPLHEAEHVATLEAVDRSVVKIDYVNGLTFAMQTSGQQVWVKAPSGMEDEEIQRFLLGPILGLLLRYRGVTCLHATAIHDDRLQGCFALLGPTGAGKSTLAAALLQERGVLIGDDLLALSLSHGGVSIQAGRTRIRLWPDSAGALYGSDAEFPAVSSEMPKLQVAVPARDANSSSQPVPLRAVYSLSPSDSGTARMTVRDLAGGDALLALVANTYPPPESHPLTPGVRAQEFEALGQVVERVRVREATYERDFSTLPELCRTILEDVGTLGSAPRCTDGS